MPHRASRYTAGASPVAQYESSFEIISAASSSDEASVISGLHPSDTDDEDEIVWSLSSSSIISIPPIPSEDDYVILSRSSLPPSPGTARPVVGETASLQPHDLSQSMSKLSISSEDQLAREVPPSPTSKPKYKRKKQWGTSVPRASMKTPVPSPPDSNAALARKDEELSFCARSIVDDVSDAMSTTSDTESVPSVYEEAVRCVTLFLTNPAQRSINNLTFLQSLIIELGLAPPTAPHSLNSARAILKSNAFVNIRDYLAVRGEGLAAIQRIMYPSKNALIKDIRRRKNRTPLTWVKQNGLQVLLVSCYH